MKKENNKFLNPIFFKMLEKASQPIKNIYQDNELDSKATSNVFLEVRKEGNRNISRNDEIKLCKCSDIYFCENGCEFFVECKKIKEKRI